MANDIHILILSSWYPTQTHPFLGNFVQRQAELLGRKFKVTVINTEVYDGPETNLSENQKEEFREIIAFYPNHSNRFARKKNERSAFVKALKLLDPVDLVIGHVLNPKGWQFIIAKKRLQCPLIYVEHGSYFRKEKRKDWSYWHHLLLKKLSNRTDEIVAVSEFLKQDLIDFYPKHSIEVIGNHIELDLFTSAPKSNNGTTQFLHVSTLDPNTKNPQGIIDACAITAETHPNFEMTIICDEDAELWKTYVEQRHLSKYIKFKGAMEWNELVPYYHKANAFVLFSDYESFSIVLAEAMATGTPIITTPVGIASNIPPEIGILIPPRDIQTLSSAMATIIDNSISFDSTAMSNYAEQFGSDQVLNQWTNLIHKHVG